MKNNWQTKKLGEVCNFQNGFAFKSKLFFEKGFPILRISNIQQDKISHNRLIFFKKENYDIDFEKYKVKKGDLVIAMSGATTGKLAVNNTDEIFYLNQRVGKFKSKENLSKEFLYYFLTTRIEENLKISLGSAQPNLSTEQIKNFQIPLPSLPEQNRIVKILDGIFGEIENAKKNAEKNLQNSKELFESYLQNVFANCGDDWEEKKLGEICEKTSNIKWQDHKKEKIKYIDLSAVSRNNLKITNPVLIDYKNAPSRAKKIIRKDDVIFATTRPTLKRITRIFSEYNNQICSTGFAILRAKKNKVFPEIVFYFLQTSMFIENMEKLQRGASYPAVSDNDVKNQMICFPKALIIQKQIISKLDALSAETKKLEWIYKQKLADLEELKKSVLKKAFKGDL